MHRWRLKQQTNGNAITVRAWPEANVGQQYQKEPDHLVNQILTVPATINPEKRPAVGSRPGSIFTFQDLHLTSTQLG